ncbi:MAG: hypothetical protein NT080_06895 [Spirochaetes bacterium]|nr:hypothetical protein [Spirochaetota bacterium]
MQDSIVLEEPRFYRIIRLSPFRRTEGVSFDLVPMGFLPRIDGIDRVVHARSAVSPGPVGAIRNPWYMHPHQEDNLLVLHGIRVVDIFTVETGRVETFSVEPDRIVRNGEVVCGEPCMLVWPTGVFHRIMSGEHGSASLNFAKRAEGFDIASNFDIFDLDIKTGRYEVIRKGYLDQAPG